MSSIKGESVFIADAIASLYSDIQTLETTVLNNKAAYDSAVAAFDSKDVALEATLDSHIASYTSKVASLESVDASNTSSLSAQVANFESKSVVLDDTDASIQSQIDEHISAYGSKILALDVANTVFQENLDERIAYYNTRISGLDDTDASLASQFSEHLSNYTSKKTELFGVNSSFSSQVASHIAVYDTKTADLDAVDTGILASLTSHIVVYDTKTADLDGVDASISSDIQTHISAYESRVAGLDSVDASLQSQNEQHLATYTSKTTALDATDASLQSQITAHTSAYTTKVAQLEATNASINSQLGSHIATYNETVQSLINVDSSLTSIVDSHKASYDTKIEDLAIAKAALDATFASISSQIAGMDTDIITRVSDEIDTKVDQTEFDNAVSSLMAVDSALYSGLATKVTELAQAAVDSTQNALIASKVAQSAFDTKTSSLESLNLDWEDRFRVIEESFKTILATYKIQKPDTTFYDYTGVNQKLSSLPPVFGIAGKKVGPTANDWILVLQFTSYGYTTLLGNVVAGISTGNITITKEDIDPVTLRYELVIPNSRSGSSFVNVTIPFEIIYKNYNGTSLYSLQFTTAMFNSLTLMDPPTITYSSSSSNFELNSSITSLTPTVTGGVATGYSISPELPTGLIFDTATGTISGTPTVESNGSYTITASNLYGSKTFNLTIKTYIPLDILYSTNQNYVIGAIITPLAPIDNTIFDATTWSISPALPTGLSFNTSTGTITGTPSVESSNNYTVTATNQFGSDTFVVNIKTYRVLDITYATPQNLAVGTAVTITPSDNTMFDATFWVITPALPTGLNLNSITGVISGTPTVTSSSKTYAITATNLFGSDTYTLTLATGTKPVFSYSSPQTYGINEAITALSPTSTGGTATSWSISPALPNGLSLNTSTGVISGTPTGESVATTYTITATNAFGSGTATLSITTTILYTPGGVLWGRWIDGSSSDDVSSITADSLGNIYVTGTSGDTLQSSLLTYFNEAKPGSNTSSGAFVMKYNSNGTPIWGRWIDGNSFESGRSIATDSSGNVYVTGYSESSALQSSLLTYFNQSKPFTGAAVFVLKYNTNGTPQWGRWIDGSAIDDGYGIAVDSLQNVYVTGYTTGSISTITFNESLQLGSNWATFVVKFDINGTSQWGRWINGTGYEQGNDITIDSSGNVYIIGYSTSSALQTSLLTYFNEAKPGNTSGGAFVIKYDTLGVPQWARWIDSNSFTTENGISIATDSSNNVYVTGNSNSSALQTSLLTYFNEAKPGSTSNGNFIIKYNTNGTPLWGRWIDGTNSDEGRGIKIDYSGNVYVTGYSTSELLQPSLRTYFNESKPGSFGAGYLIKYNTNGTPQWGKWIDGTDGQYGNDVTVDNFGSVYVIGYSDSSTLQNSLLTYFNEPKPGGTSQGAFIIKYESGNPPSISYNNQMYSPNIAITPLTPTVYNRTPTSWSINPALPTGLNFNTTTGAITGSTTASSGTYTITATNSFGSSTTTVNITVANSGDVLWGRWIDGAGYDRGSEIATDSLGNLYILGTTDLTVQSSLLTYFNEPKPGGTSTGLYVIKYNSIGVPQWGRWIDGSGFEYTNRGIATDSSGNVYITGYTSSFSLQNSLLTYFNTTKPDNSNSVGTFVIKYNTSGVPEWARWIDGSSSATEDVSYNITVDNSGNVYVTGETYSSSLNGFVSSKPSSSTNPSGFIVKYNTSGIIQWGNWIDGSSYERGYGVTTDSSGNVYVTGLAYSIQSALLTYFNEGKPNTTTNNSAAFIIKYNTNGTPLWGRWIDGAYYDVGYDVAADSDGNVYVNGFFPSAPQSSLLTYFGGTFNSGSCVIKYNSSGTPQWAKSFEITSNAIVVDSSNNFYVVGDSSSIPSSLESYFTETKPGANGGAIIVKCNNNGVPIWAKWIDGSSNDKGLGVAVDSFGGVYITGYTTTTTVQNSILTYFNEAKPGTNEAAFVIKMKG